MSEGSFAMVDQPNQPYNMTTHPPQVIAAPQRQVPGPPSDFNSQPEDLIGQAAESLYGSSFSNYRVQIHKWDYTAAWIIEVVLVNIVMLRDLTSNQIYAVMYYLASLHHVFPFGQRSQGCLQFHGCGANSRASVAQSELPVGTQDFNDWLTTEFKFLHHGNQRIDFPHCTDTRFSLMIERIIVNHCLVVPAPNQDAVNAIHHQHLYSTNRIQVIGGKHHGLSFCCSEVLTDWSYFYHTIRGKNEDKFQPLKIYMTACLNRCKNHSEAMHLYAQQHIGVKVSLDDMDSFKVSSLNPEDTFSYWKVVDLDTLNQLKHTSRLYRSDRAGGAQYLSKDFMTALLIAEIELGDIKHFRSTGTHHLHLIKVVVDFGKIMRSFNYRLDHFCQYHASDIPYEESLKCFFEVDVIHIIAHFQVNYNPRLLKHFLRKMGYMTHYNTFDFKNVKGLYTLSREVQDVSNNQGFIPRFSSSIQPPHACYVDENLIGQHISESAIQMSYLDDRIHETVQRFEHNAQNDHRQFRQRMMPPPNQDAHQLPPGLTQQVD